MEPIITAQQVTERVLLMAEDTFQSWFDDDESIDWDDDSYGFWSRMESDHNISLGDVVDTPAMRKIQRHIRQYKKQ